MNTFTRIVDELVLLSSKDPELSDGLKYIDQNVPGDNFYNKLYHTLYGNKGSPETFVLKEEYE